MILVLGGTGYIGSFIVQYLKQHGFNFIAPKRNEIDIINSHELLRYIDDYKCSFIINAIGYTGKPNVEECEQNTLECYYTNVLIPDIINRVCKTVNIKWGHISSGCIYNGYHKIFNESDPPNFCFESPPFSWYSGSKAHGEIRAGDNCYIWRIRMPISSVASQRNYLDKLTQYEKVLVTTNSITWVEQFVSNLPLFWETNVKPGIYNMVSSYPITAMGIHAQFSKYNINYHRDYVTLDDFNSMISTPRSNCVLDNKKSLDVGAIWDNPEDAITRCLEHRVNNIEQLDYSVLSL